MYRVVLHKRALKDYQKQDARTQERLDEALEDLSQHPYKGPSIKRLSGELSDLFRYRVGSLRILYEIHEELRMVRVKAIASRGDIYK